MTPLFWSILLVAILSSIIIVIGMYFIISKDKKEQERYIEYLKKQNYKLKNNQQRDVVPGKEASIYLFKDTIEYIAHEFKSRYDHDILEDPEFVKPGTTSDKDKAIMIAGYKTLIAELTVMENSQTPSEVWQRIQNILSMLTFDDLSKSQNNQDQSEQLKIALQRIENLETFKKLYFELQNKMAANISMGESLNAELIETLAELPDSEKFIKLLEKHNSHYIEMGKMADMDKDKHHYSVQYLDSFSEQYMNERKAEVKRLKTQVAQQFEEIWKLQTQVSSKENNDTFQNSSQTTSPDLTRQLKDAELCIETMDMEIQSMTAQIDDLKKEFEEASSSKSGEVTQLTEFLEQSKSDYKALEQKYMDLEKSYADMENRYLEIANK